MRGTQRGSMHPSYRQRAPRRGLTLIGLLAVHMFEHRYFGWGVVRARLVEDLLAWVLPSLALGLALGRWLVRGTTVVALVAATTLLALLNPLPWQDGPLDWSEFGAVFFMLALNPGGLVLVALLAGARLGKHWAWKSVALARR